VRKLFNKHNIAKILCALFIFSTLNSSSLIVITGEKPPPVIAQPLIGIDS